MNAASKPLLPRSAGLKAAPNRLAWADVDEKYLQKLARRAKEEDLDGMGLRNPPDHKGDRTVEALDLNGQGSASLVTRNPMVACGSGIIPFILNAFGGEATLETFVEDGDYLKSGFAMGQITGSKKTLLAAERSLLNFLQRLSGIATQTRKFTDLLEGGKPRLLDTRKTTPGHRVLEKYAVAAGGGWNHRFGLFDRVMIKDNHLEASKASAGEFLTELVLKAKARAPDLLIQVEVDRLEQIPPILKAKPDALLLDNFALDELKEAIRIIDSTAITEASGGITLENVNRYKDLDLDFVSTSAVVGQSAWSDIGLDWAF